MKNNNSIRVSEKHGVNPSLTICCWCGESKGIALLGKLPGDKEAPKEIIADYDPCDKCKEQWQQGVPIIAVSTTPKTSNQPPITVRNNIMYYPTGAYAVVKQTVFEDPDKFEIGKPVLMDENDFNAMMPEPEK